MTTALAADDPSADEAPPPRQGRSERFFSWTAGLGVVRGEGWFGGVAAGFGARTRVDPVIVRGILVVLAVIGFPVALLYGVAWALLPDLDGRIPVQEAFRGRFSSSQVGAAVFVLAGAVPPPIVWLLGAPSVSFVLTAAGPFVGLVLLIAVLIVFFVVAADRGSTRVTPPSMPTAPTRAETAETDSPADEDDSPPAPAGTREDTSPEADDMIAWRAQHAAWKEQDQLWRREQHDAARSVREHLRRERQARATAFAADAAARRRAARATNPRAPFAYASLIVGLAVVIGAGMALSSASEYAVARGLFVGALITALGMILAGAFRRRSGFLAFATGATLVAALAAGAAPVMGELHIGSYGFSNSATTSTSAREPYTQVWGELYLYLDDIERDSTLYVEKGRGGTYITVAEGVAVDLDITTRDASATLGAWGEEHVLLGDAPGVATETLADGRTRFTGILTAGREPATTQQTLVVEQASGYLDLQFETNAPMTEGDPPMTDSVHTSDEAETIDGGEPEAVDSLTLSRPRTRWAAIVWGLAFAAAAAWGLWFTSIDDRPAEVVASLVDLGPATAVGYAVLGAGSIILIVAFAAALRRVQVMRAPGGGSGRRQDSAR